MQKNLKLKLSKPFGALFSVSKAVESLNNHKEMLIVVGDKSACNLLQRGVRPHICIYDFICKRKPIAQKMKLQIKEFCPIPKKVKNPPGKISAALKAQVVQCIKRKNGCIHVDGEEDLSALVACAYAPEGSIVAYGQPKKGIVLVRINRENKKEAKKLLTRI